MSASTVISAIETYRKKFPIANFLHYPSLISDISSNFESVDSVFIASLLSLCVRFMSSDGLEDEETYAGYAQKHLSHRVMEAPSLYLAQSLVMISFYEWGTGRPYQAWMYSGMCGNETNLITVGDDSNFSRNGHIYDPVTSQNGRRQYGTQSTRIPCIPNTVRAACSYLLVLLCARL